MTTPTHTPNDGTGLTGAWHVAHELAVRADLPLGGEAHLGGVGWLEDVTAAQWATLTEALWMQGESGRVRRPSEYIRADWARVGHHLVAPIGLRVVLLPVWVAPVLYRPDGSRRRCSVAYPPGGPPVVVVSDAGDVVAFVPEMRRPSATGGR